MKESELIAAILRLQEAGDYSQALTLAEKAEIPEGSRSGDFYIALGKLYHAVGRHGEAVSNYCLAASLRPYNVDILLPLARALKEQGRALAATRFLMQAGEIEAENPDIWYELGNVLQILERKEDAAHCYQEVLRLRPGDASAQHMLAALKGEEKTEVPSKYIRDLFNEYAPRFEASLQDGLGYDISQKMAQMLDGGHWNRALDLGVGTGLVGQALLGMIDEITGVDISPNMLKEAEAKRIYQKLVCADIKEFLEQERNTYDLIIAADVFVYIGDIYDIFKYASQTMADNGAFIFSIELSSQQDLELRPHGRFAHSLNYIENLAQEFGFRIEKNQDTPIRLEMGIPIPGKIIALGKLSP